MSYFPIVFDTVDRNFIHSSEFNCRTYLCGGNNNGHCVQQKLLADMPLVTVGYLLIVFISSTWLTMAQLYVDRWFGMCPRMSTFHRLVGLILRSNWTNNVHVFMLYFPSFCDPPYFLISCTSLPESLLIWYIYIYIHYFLFFISFSLCWNIYAGENAAPSNLWYKSHIIPKNIFCLVLQLP